MIGTFLSVVSGLMTIVILLFVIIGFRRSINSPDDISRWFTRGLSYVIGGYVARGFYWDVFWQLFRHYDRESAYRWSEATGGTAINIVFCTIIIYGCGCFLMCRHYMIHPEERHRWPWWKSFMHPDNLKEFLLLFRRRY